MIPHPRIWLYKPTPTTVEVLIVGPFEQIARIVAISSGALAMSPDLECVVGIGLGSQAMLFHGTVSAVSEHDDPIAAALKALQRALPAGLVAWCEGESCGMVGTW